MTTATDLRPLRRALVEATERHGRRSSQALQAFEELFRAAAKSGQPLDQLRRYSKNEVERFFARTVPGPDGHVYWDGGKEFATNDGHSVRPRRWWWFHQHGRPAERIQVMPVCGQANCIYPGHMRAIPWSELKLRYTDEQIIGAIQVVAMRLGRAPSCDEWDGGHWRPNRGTLEARFGSWNNAMRAAGLEPRPKGIVVTHGGGPVSLDEEGLLRAGATLIRELGYVPSSYEWSRRNYQPSYSTLKRRFGTWRAFIEAISS